jgi:hypothetical protein
MALYVLLPAVSGDPRLCFNCWCALDAYTAANQGSPLISIMGNPRHPSWVDCLSAFLTSVAGLKTGDIAALTDSSCVNGFDSSKCAGGSAGARAKSSGTPSTAARVRAAPAANAASARKPLPNVGH